MGGLGPTFREEDIYAGNLIGSYEALDAGVTTTVDWFNNAMLAECGATVSVAPHVELVMGQGIPPTNRGVERGLRPSLSTDVASAVPGDMFTQMRTALAHARGAMIPADPDEPFAPRLTAEDVLSFATIDGAAACGLAAVRSQWARTPTSS